MKNSFTIDEFLDLQKLTDIKLHLRDACGMGVIEISEPNDDLINLVVDFFEKRNRPIEISDNKRYIYSKKI